MKKDNMRNNNNNSRRVGGRNNSGGNRNNHSSGNRNNHRRTGNPRVQTFDSNGPGVRVRGTAFQINEKYITLASDAASAGDRVLEEGCLQHAEHYQRFINEITEKQQKQQEQQQELQRQQAEKRKEEQEKRQEHQEVTNDEDKDSKLNDLDQGFLVGGRDEALKTKTKANDLAEIEEAPKEENTVKISEEDKPKKKRAVRKPRKKPVGVKIEASPEADL